LEDNAKDGDTERLPKSLEEAVHNTSEKEVIIKNRGLRGKALCTEEYTKTDSSDKEEKDLKGYIN
jgi:hypothetical protein